MRFLCLLHLLSVGKNRLALYKFLLVVVVLVVAVVLAIVRKIASLVEIVSNSANLSAVFTLSFSTAFFAEFQLFATIQPAHNRLSMRGVNLNLLAVWRAHKTWL